MIWDLLIYVFDFLQLYGVFFSFIFGFWKFRNCILNQNSHFWGLCFIKLFYLRPPYICFRFFGSLGVFFMIIFFLKFQNCILNQNYHFWEVYFMKLFYLRPPYIYFWFFGTLRGLFWVCFLKILKLYFELEFPLVGGSVLWNFLIWGFFVHWWWFYWQ